LVKPPSEIVKQLELARQDEIIH